MKTKLLSLFTKSILIVMSTIFLSCSTDEKKEESDIPKDDFNYLLEQFADLKIMRYKVPKFEKLPLQQKKLLYYLSQAALAGRDIIFDQNYKHNLAIKRTLEEVVKNYKGDRTSKDFQDFMVYTKRMWFSNGIHHHYSTDKFIPDFSVEYFAEIVNSTESENFPLQEGETKEMLIEKLTPIMFDPEIDAKRVCLDDSKDMIVNSANNFYEGVTQKEVEDFYANMVVEGDFNPISYGLNSKVVKENGKVAEKVYKLNGMYGPAIEQILFWLNKTLGVSENKHQVNGIGKLMEFYRTGDLRTFDEFNVFWLKDKTSRIDYVNGFTEVYGDPMGMKATWESVINFKDIKASKRTQIISDNAQWFEDNSPTDSLYKKKEVKGVIAKVITVAQLGGDCYPSTPIGINLPNSDWIRKNYGSKSVTMENITYAYDQSLIGSGFLEEFAATDNEIELNKKYGFLSGNLHTDLHECLGHGSGQLLPEVSSEALKNYGSALEETRADLFALYYMSDPKMVELGLMPNLDVAKTEYNSYIRNGLMTQLTRIQMGKDIEQAHMRNRQLISKWCYEKGKDENVISMEKRNGKSYVQINDYDKLRELFGELLAEVQRIKSTGDFAAGKELVETYGINVDRDLHAEVLDRFGKLNLAPYGGFVNPILVPVMQGKEIVDIKVEYPGDYTAQMMEYAEKCSFLPTYN